LIVVTSITKVYETPSCTVKALDGASATINDNEFVLIVGRSGSGKSTLLSVLGGLTRPSDGKVELNGRDIWKMDDTELSKVRSHEIGFVFQFPGLMPTLNTLENVMLPAMFSDKKTDVAKRAEELLVSLGLGDKLASYPHQLSGGELKRAAIARALLNDPSVILADEPTGDLDADTEMDIMELFREINKKGKTIVMVTHNPELSTYATRVFRMAKGKLQIE
jgi:putative ABC transport system ATP-binding protein